jgi:DNA-binding CsgD family transcriptional regulator
MRVAIVGRREARARLRASLAAASIDVVAEYSTLSQARAAEPGVDALLVAPDSIDDPDDPGDLPSHRDERLQPDEQRPDDPGARPRRPERGQHARLPDPHIETLTPREMEVLELLAEGLANKAIAGRLAISDQTVKFHIASILGKLGASNRTDAVRRALRRGLLTL